MPLLGCVLIVSRQAISYMRNVCKVDRLLDTYCINVHLYLQMFMHFLINYFFNFGSNFIGYT